MLTFLAPGALFGLLLLAIPVAVHLFQAAQDAADAVQQSALAAHQPQQRLSRRIQWHQLLLFLLRAGSCCCWSSPWPDRSSVPANAAAVDRFIVLDVSRSMDYRVTAGQRRWRWANSSRRNC